MDFMTEPFLLSISVFVFSSFITFHLFGSMWQIKLAIRQLLGARKYSVTCRMTKCWLEHLAVSNLCEFNVSGNIMYFNYDGSWTNRNHRVVGGWRDGGGGHCLVWMELHQAGRSICLPVLIFPCTIKSRSSVLALAHPGGPGKGAVKWLWCFVVILCCCHFNTHNQN